MSKELDLWVGAKALGLVQGKAVGWPCRCLQRAADASCFQDGTKFLRGREPVMSTGVTLPLTGSWLKFQDPNLVVWGYMGVSYHWMFDDLSAVFRENA